MDPLGNIMKCKHCETVFSDAFGMVESIVTIQTLNKQHIVCVVSGIQSFFTCGPVVDMVHLLTSSLD